MAVPLFTQYEKSNGESRVLEHPALKLTDAERAAGVTPVNYAYPENDVLRLAVADGSADDTSAFQAAINTAAKGGTREIYLHGRSIRVTAPLTINQQHLHIIGPGSFIVDHTGVFMKRATSGTAARCKFDRFRVLAKQNSTIAFDMDQWQYSEMMGLFVGSYDGTHEFARAFKLSNVAYWNVGHGLEIEAAPIAFDLNDANDSRFSNTRHVRFSGTATNTILFSGGCSGVKFNGISCENVYASADVVSFHSTCERCSAVDGRIEARVGSTSVLPLKFNGSKGNKVDLYVLGAGIGAITDTIGDNEVTYYTTAGTFRYMGTGVVRMPTTVGSPGNAGEVMYDSTAGLFRGHASGSSRNFVQTPAIETFDMNGNNLELVNRLSLVDGITAPSTVAGRAFIYVDTADGSLKVKFGSGTVKTISTDP
jgi:hypothetical protein